MIDAASPLVHVASGPEPGRRGSAPSRPVIRSKELQPDAVTPFNRSWAGKSERTEHGKAKSLFRRGRSRGGGMLRTCAERSRQCFWGERAIWKERGVESAVALSITFTFQLFHLSSEPVGHFEKDHVVSWCGEQRACVAAGDEDAGVREVLLLSCPHGVEVRAGLHLPAEDGVQSQ